MRARSHTQAHLGLLLLLLLSRPWLTIPLLVCPASRRLLMLGLSLGRLLRRRLLLLRLHVLIWCRELLLVLLLLLLCVVCGDRFGLRLISEIDRVMDILMYACVDTCARTHTHTRTHAHKYRPLTSLCREDVV